MDADGKNQKRLTDDPALDDSPTWSPDGTSIAFVSRRDENAELYVMDTEGGNLRRLTNTKTLETAPNWGR
jgi:TolB protein